jgi:hypothetical protein
MLSISPEKPSMATNIPRRAWVWSRSAVRNLESGRRRRGPPVLAFNEDDRRLLQSHPKRIVDVIADDQIDLLIAEVIPTGLNPVAMDTAPAI